MQGTLAIFGGSFNPPGLHHLRIVGTLSAHFDEVVVVPCGPRHDKPTVNDIEPDHRAAMVDMTFASLESVRVDPFDLEAATFTKTHNLDTRFSEQDLEVWHVVGSDLVSGGRDGTSFIQREWEHGPEIWRRLNFAVVTRPGIQLQDEDLPPNHRLFEIDVDGTSSGIRERAFRHESIDDLVVPRVAAYIERYGLYRGSMPRRTTSSRFADEPRAMIVMDQQKEGARRIGDFLSGMHANPEDADLIIVIGGDGFMMHAIRDYWHLRLPFFGINQGTYGFLLNDVPAHLVQEVLRDNLVFRRSPLLHVRFDRDAAQSGRNTQEVFAVNDAWVERASGQSAWLEIAVDDQIRLKMAADGVLLATPVGSTAYARAMGAPPLPLDTEALVLAGSNVLRPARWNHPILPLGSTIGITGTYPGKRPIRGYVDGVDCGVVGHMRARISRVAAFELVFTPDHDPAEKLMKIQFPGE